MNVRPRRPSPARAAGRTGRRSRVRSAVAVATFVATAAGCGVLGPGDTDPDGALGDRLEATLVARDHLTAQDAACVRDQVVDALTVDELRSVVEGSLAALPSGRWSAYSYAYLECVLADELVPPGTDAAEEAP